MLDGLFYKSLRTAYIEVVFLKGIDELIKRKLFHEFRASDAMQTKCGASRDVAGLFLEIISCSGRNSQ